MIINIMYGQTNFYLETAIDSNGYDIEIYRSDKPVKMNDEEDYYKKNGRTICEADYIGSVSGAKDMTDSSGFDASKERDEERDGDIFLTDQGWEFSFNGPEHSEVMDRVREAVKKEPIQLQCRGRLKLLRETV